MHPPEQVRVIGPVADRCRGVGAADLAVDAAHAGAHPRHLVVAAEGDHAHVVGGATQPAPGVRTEVGMLQYAGHRRGVHCLEQQGSQAGYPQDRVRVHLPGKAFRSEKTLIFHPSSLACGRYSDAGDRRPDHRRCQPKGRRGQDDDRRVAGGSAG